MTFRMTSLLLPLHNVTVSQIMGNGRAERKVVFFWIWMFCVVFIIIVIHRIVYNGSLESRAGAIIPSKLQLHSILETALRSAREYAGREGIVTRWDDKRPEDGQIRFDGIEGSSQKPIPIAYRSLPWSNPPPPPEDTTDWLHLLRHYCLQTRHLIAFLHQKDLVVAFVFYTPITALLLISITNPQHRPQRGKIDKVVVDDRSSVSVMPL